MNAHRIVILVTLLSGCATVGPIEKSARLSVIPEIDIRDTPVADAIAALVGFVNRPDDIAVVVVPINVSDNPPRKIRFPRLDDACAGKKITIDAFDVRLIDVLTLLSNSVGLKWKFSHDRIVITTSAGEIVAE